MTPETAIVRPVSDLDAASVVQRAKALSVQYEASKAQETQCLGELGMIHLRASEDKAVIEAAGCESLKQFEETVLGSSHSTIGQVSAFFREYRIAGPETFERLGFNRCRVLVHYVKTCKPSQKQKSEALALAEESDNAGHLKRKLEGQPNVTAGGLTQSRFTLEGPEVDVQEFKGFVDDERVQAYFETKVPLLIANRAIQETSSEWGKE